VQRNRLKFAVPGGLAKIGRTLCAGWNRIRNSRTARIADSSSNSALNRGVKQGGKSGECKKKKGGPYCKKASHEKCAFAAVLLTQKSISGRTGNIPASRRLIRTEVNRIDGKRRKRLRFPTYLLMKGEKDYKTGMSTLNDPDPGRVPY
jgi:hypothetical protein